MLFLKPKPMPNELLPPPPPFPSLDLEEKPKPGPVMAESSSEDRFEDLFKDVKDINPKTIKEKTASKIKTLKLKQKQIKIKGLNDKLKTKQKFSDYSQDDFEDFDLPKDLETDEYIKKGLKSRPKELAEAEDEIKTAIEKIKEHEKPSLFGSFFRSKKPEPETGMSIQEIPEDNVSRIIGKINNARQSLMNLDLQRAREEYLEIMKAYNELRPGEQRKVFYEIKNLYYERKSAESLKFQ